MSDKAVAPLNQYWHGPVWNFFSLTYASYLVVPRAALCAMPENWQEKFVALLEEARERLPEGILDVEYWVRATNGKHFIQDPLSDYRHPPRIELRERQPST